MTESYTYCLRPVSHSAIDGERTGLRKRSQRAISTVLRIFLAAFCALPPWVHAQAPPPRKQPPRAKRKRPPQVLFIQAGKLYTVRKGVIEKGTVVIRGSTIEKVGGPFVEVPEGARVFRFPEATAVPGFIDGLSGLYLKKQEVERLSGSDPSRRIIDAVDYFQGAWREAVRAGVTACYVSAGPRSMFPAQGTVLRLTGATSSTLLAVPGGANVEACLWPEASSWRQRAPRSRQGRVQVTVFGIILRVSPPRSAAPSPFDLLGAYRRLKDALLRARAYKLRRTWYEQDLGAWERAVAKLKKEAEQAKREGKTPPRKPKPPRPSKPPEDPFAEALLPVLEGKKPLCVWAESVEEIRLALKLAGEFSLRLVFLGAFESHLVSEEIARAKAGVILLPACATPSLRPGLRLSRTTALRLFQAGVPFGLGTGPAPLASSHLLRQYAAQVVARGVDPEYVLRTLTLTSAQLLGVSDRLGSIEEGKEAHVVVLKGDPLSPLSEVLLTVSAGNIVYPPQKAAPPKPQGKPQEEGKGP